VTSVDAGAARSADPCTLVIFGAAGDLTRRLLIPALYNLAKDRRLPDRFDIVGFARTDTDEDALREQFRTGVEESVDTVDQRALAWLLSRFSYVRSEFDDEDGWRRLVERLHAGTGGKSAPPNCLFYLATAPEQFVGICDHLASLDLLEEADGWRRVIIEKPFGRDAESARALNAHLTRLMDEKQIYRIDHYLGKETVQNILVFRFGNGIFEPIWNRRYIDHVQITVAETVGVEGRGSYYDHTGALRDMVPNHLFQLLTLTAMEPPSSFSATALHNEQAKVLDAVVPLKREDCGVNTLRAQYVGGQLGDKAAAGYREEPRVDKVSLTETYAAFRLLVDNWRWAGVPFYLRTGKRLAAKRTEVVIQFRQAPLSLFRTASVGLPSANRLVVSIQPTESITLELAAKPPGPEVTTSPVEMTFCYKDFFGVERRTGYETLLYDAMIGDRSLFKRADVIEKGWTIVDPILRAWEDNACDILYYPAGSEGPEEADRLLDGDDRWRHIGASTPPAAKTSGLLDVPAEAESHR
jgi:glucose-6-phosphate 1-dehydrogenase